MNRIIINNETPAKHYLFFDTETIGVPAEFNVLFPEGSVQIILQFNPNNLATLFFSMIIEIPSRVGYR